MSATPIRAAHARRTETPNAFMTTLASPSQGPTEHLSMWLVDMRAGQQGPPHVYDAEQIWHLLEGNVDIAVDGDHVALSPGDTLILPAGTVRQRTQTSVWSRAAAATRWWLFLEKQHHAEFHRGLNSPTKTRRRPSHRVAGPAGRPHIPNGRAGRTAPQWTKERLHNAPGRPVRSLRLIMAQTGHSSADMVRR